MKYVALNPGSSFRGLHDSLVNHLGNEDPQMLLCLHEEHAVAIAHGYAKVAGEPLAVILKNPEVFAGKRVGVVITGGNVDLDKLPWMLP